MFWAADDRKGLSETKSDQNFIDEERVPVGHNSEETSFSTKSSGHSIEPKTQSDNDNKNVDHFVTNLETVEENNKDSAGNTSEYSEALKHVKSNKQLSPDDQNIDDSGMGYLAYS